jgi:hypothetical protein
MIASCPDIFELPAATLRQVDQICTCFERDWKSGAAPSIEGYLGQLESSEPAHGGTLLRELLLVELEYRRHRGESPSKGRV